MSLPSDRRQFLATTALGGLGLLGRLPAVSADEATLDAKVVHLDPGIEPLVRLLEDTPRDRLLEEVGGRIKKGLSYREVLAACSWPACATSSHGRASGSSSTPS